MDVRLTQPQAARLPRLLHLEYLVRELAEELGCTTDQLRHAIAVGCPHRKVGTDQIYIVGDEFRDWYLHCTQRRKISLKPEEFYCLHCRAGVTPARIERRPLLNQVVIESSLCPICGNRINRFRSGTEVDL